MTREEAIYCLKSYQPDAPDDMCQKCKYYKSVKLAPNVYTCISDKAREMAIQALEQNESAEEWYKLFVEKLDELDPCEDAISRENAITSINKLFEECEEWRALNDLQYGKNQGLSLAIDVIEDLPPVTPTCEEREKGECPYYAG